PPSLRPSLPPSQLPRPRSHGCGGHWARPACLPPLIPLLLLRLRILFHSRRRLFQRGGGGGGGREGKSRHLLRGCPSRKRGGGGGGRGGGGRRGDDAHGLLPLPQAAPRSRRTQEFILLRILLLCFLPSLPLVHALLLALPPPSYLRRGRKTRGKLAGATDGYGAYSAGGKTDGRREGGREGGREGVSHLAMAGDEILAWAVRCTRSPSNSLPAARRSRPFSRL
ncbi:hypothetical protein Naga_101958g1, partial [Nannochloropsis gaditana]